MPRRVETGDVICPYCAQLVASNVALAGQPVHCPHCHSPFIAPLVYYEPKLPPRDREKPAKPRNENLLLVVVFIVAVLAALVFASK